MKIGSIERFILEKNKKNKDNNFQIFISFMIWVLKET